ncbi:hypothetical protein HK100_011191 [Physocladia obscura]|uniref:SAM domain-containing protein n=1 Tax=Physocladia obscura TaxID=109957 RepID=A0AAD5T281_9FUNG|nr:hypothetical protein HK100_011191 [Physocladia obscura]
MDQKRQSQGQLPAANADSYTNMNANANINTNSYDYNQRLSHSLPSSGGFAYQQQQQQYNYYYQHWQAQQQFQNQQPTQSQHDALYSQYYSYYQQQAYQQQLYQQQLQQQQLQQQQRFQVPRELAAIPPPTRGVGVAIPLVSRSSSVLSIPVGSNVIGQQLHSAGRAGSPTPSLSSASHPHPHPHLTQQQHQYRRPGFPPPSQSQSASAVVPTPAVYSAPPNAPFLFKTPPPTLVRTRSQPQAQPQPQPLVQPLQPLVQSVNPALPLTSAPTNGLAASSVLAIAPPAPNASISSPSPLSLVSSPPPPQKSPPSSPRHSQSHSIPVPSPTMLSPRSLSLSRSGAIVGVRKQKSISSTTSTATTTGPILPISPATTDFSATVFDAVRNALELASIDNVDAIEPPPPSSDDTQITSTTTSVSISDESRFSFIPDEELPPPPPPKSPVPLTVLASPVSPTVLSTTHQTQHHYSHKSNQNQSGSRLAPMGPRMDFRKGGNPFNWNPGQVAEWIKSLGAKEETISIILESKTTMATLSTQTAESLADTYMIKKLGPRLLVFDQIQKFKSEWGVSAVRSDSGSSVSNLSRAPSISFPELSGADLPPYKTTDRH